MAEMRRMEVATESVRLRKKPENKENQHIKSVCDR